MKGKRNLIWSWSRCEYRILLFFFRNAKVAQRRSSAGCQICWERLCLRAHLVVIVMRCFTLPLPGQLKFLAFSSSAGSIKLRQSSSFICIRILMKMKIPYCSMCICMFTLARNYCIIDFAFQRSNCNGLNRLISYKFNAFQK